MFKPRVPKAAMLYKVNQEMTAGTVVALDNNGFLVPYDGVAATQDVLGFLAADVRDWATRTEKDILFPNLFHGHMLACEWINQPHVTNPKLVGVRIGADYEYEVQINDNLLTGDELVANASGQLIKKPVGDTRDTLAVVKDKGTYVGMPLDYAMTPSLRSYQIRTKI